jgi:hypothetical protein
MSALTWMPTVCAGVAPGYGGGGTAGVLIHLMRARLTYWIAEVIHVVRCVVRCVTGDLGSLQKRVLVA